MLPTASAQSNAREYFEYINSQDDLFAFLSSIPYGAEPFFEKEWIDFKGYPQNDKNAKEIWGKALSGYANIAEGLIIWGIDARKDKTTGIDAANGLRLIPNPAAFESNLRDWIRDATNPPVIGVEYRSCSGPNGEGFVVCLIPESRHKPHRAEENRQYYFRAGDDFLIADPGLLRTLFYPQFYPYLWAEVTLKYQLLPEDADIEYRRKKQTGLFNLLINDRSTMAYHVQLHNTGVATARDIYVVIKSSDKLNFHQGIDWDMYPTLHGDAAFRGRRPFHPDESTELFTSSFNEFFSNRLGHNNGEIVPHFNPISLQLLLYGENVRRQDITVDFSPTDLSFESASVTKQGLPQS